MSQESKETIAVMPNAIKSEVSFNNAVSTYRRDIGTERYQPLSSLLNKIASLCPSNSIQFSTPSLSSESSK